MDFYQRVALVCRKVPPGRVATYGQIALLCEKPQNSRQVGYALNRRMPADVPAHRIMNHQGFLSGAPAFEHPDMQKWYLEEEGIAVGFDVAKQKCRVNLQKYQWQPDTADVGQIRKLFKDKRI
jgi:methylated-DNA-protein-cysteine methyltransferase-like protein